MIQKTIGFGYPNCEQLQLAVSTKLNINDQIKDRTELVYISETTQETLPNSYNGLGYKNLIKIEFLLETHVKASEKLGITENWYFGIPKVRQQFEEAQLKIQVFKVEKGEYLVEFYNSEKKERCL